MRSRCMGDRRSNKEVRVSFIPSGKHNGHEPFPQKEIGPDIPYNCQAPFNHAYCPGKPGAFAAERHTANSIIISSSQAVESARLVNGRHGKAPGIMDMLPSRKKSPCSLVFVFVLSLAQAAHAQAPMELTGPDAEGG